MIYSIYPEYRDNLTPYHTSDVVIKFDRPFYCVLICVKTGWVANSVEPDQILRINMVAHIMRMTNDSLEKWWWRPGLELRHIQKTFLYSWDNVRCETMWDVEFRPCEHEICPPNKSQITNICKFFLAIAKHETFSTSKYENASYCWYFCVACVAWQTHRDYVVHLCCRQRCWRHTFRFG